ncbi:MAG: hypothetical protein GC155_01800 [Alphaproteobacteria bacterium]|nr:hypothetical protein [Alphaproteobacteria bacterium]
MTVEDFNQLPDTLELRPSRLKWAAIFLVSAFFASVAVWLGQAAAPIARWSVAIFFTVCAFVSVVQMTGRGAGLTLDRNGFVCRSLFSSFRREWVECTGFAALGVGPRKMVGFTTVRDELLHPRLAAAARGMTGTAGALPDTYGLSANDLADLMNRFRDRAVGAMETR